MDFKTEKNIEISKQIITIVNDNNYPLDSLDPELKNVIIEERKKNNRI